MAKIAKTALTSEGRLPRLTRHEMRDVRDYIDECLRYRFNGHLASPLSKFLSASLYREVTAGLKVIIETKDFQAIKKMTIFPTEKRFVYRIDLIREASGLTGTKKVIKALLQTSSQLNDLAGQKVRRCVNDYCYSLLIDCNDNDYPSEGIHRLVRLLAAFNEREDLL